MKELSLCPDERLEPLGGGLQIVVSPAHIFSTDSILLAHFAGIHKYDTACDLGTGSGIIPLLWCKGESGPITAVDLQEKACAQLQMSLALNHLEHRVTVVQTDLRQKHPLLPRGTFDLVTMNPPYQPLGTGHASTARSDRLARQETTCTLADAAQAAANLLRFGGRFCLCHKPERLADILCTLRDCRLEAKRVRFVVQAEGRAPWLVLVEGKRGAKPGLRVEKDLPLQTADGRDSEEMAAIFGDYREH
ncbi:MAG: methyltransferase [Clostridia bacterium]|nr:methyltransferase [Clostridia bacterium]